MTADTIPRTVRNRLRMQGFSCSSDPAFEAIVPWLRLAPALTTAVVAAGTVLVSPPVLAGLAVVTGVCAATPRHPFDHGVRKVTGTPALPRNEPPRRFACLLATAWAAATAAFLGGATLAGYVLGAALVALGGLVATTHFCFGSLVYQVVFGRPSGGGSGS